MGSVHALVAAAGLSSRMGGGVNKQLLDLSGRPVVVHALGALMAVPVDGIVLVVTPGQEANFRSVLDEYGWAGQVQIVPGGASRIGSVMCGLAALPAGVDLVVVHDGARPLVRPEKIREVISQARQWGAATLAVPVKDTVKMAGEKDLVRETLPRDKLWQVQTPQVFRHRLLLDAHRAAARDGFNGTDDASLVERLGYPVKLVRGEYTNIKITTPEDIILAKALLHDFTGL